MWTIKEDNEINDNHQFRTEKTKGNCKDVNKKKWFEYIGVKK